MILRDAKRRPPPAGASGGLGFGAVFGRLFSVLRLLSFVTAGQAGTPNLLLSSGDARPTVVRLPFSVVCLLSSVLA